MAKNYPLRFYANPWKLALYVLGSGVFVVAGLLIIQGGSQEVWIGYFCLIFFGLALLVFLWQFFLAAILRRPLLEIDAHEWRSWSSPFAHPQVVAWPDIAAVTVYRQRVRRTSQYYLIVHVRNPERLPRQPIRSLNAALFRKLSDAGITLPINTLFFRTTPARGKELLDRIYATCGRISDYYGVQIAEQVEPL